MKFSDPQRKKAMTCLHARLRGARHASISPIFWGFVLFALGLTAWTGCGSWNGSVGAILGKDNRTGRVFVREVPPGLGAARAGIEEGDEVTRIDDKPVSAMTPDELRSALRGKVGTYVTVTVMHHGETRDVRVERSPFQEQ